jgi:hypothetical protein
MVRSLVLVALLAACAGGEPEGAAVAGDPGEWVDTPGEWVLPAKN